MQVSESRTDLSKLASKSDSASTAVPVKCWREATQHAKCFSVCVETFTTYRDVSLLMARSAPSQACVNDWIGLAGCYTKRLNQARYYDSLTTEARKARQQELTTWLEKSLAWSETLMSLISLWPSQDHPQYETAKRAWIADPEEDMDLPVKRQRHSDVTIRAPA